MAEPKVVDPRRFMTSQGTAASDLVEQLRRYTDSIQGKNELHCGIMMCNSSMIESIEIIEVLLGEINKRQNAAFDLMVAVTAEVNYKGAGGYVLARLSDARETFGFTAEEILARSREVGS